MENKELKELHTALQGLIETVDHFAESERESYKDRKRLAKQLSEILLANEDAEDRLDFGYEPYVTTIGIGFGACSIVNRLKKQDLMVDEYKMLEADESALNDIIREASFSDLLILIACLGGKSGDILTNAVSHLKGKHGDKVAVLVTTPFEIEGARRKEKAEQNLESLRRFAKKLYVFSNGEYKRKCASFQETFEQIDRAIADKITEAVICIQ